VVGSDDGPVPTELVAETENWYAVPLARPVMWAVVGGGEPVTSRPVQDAHAGVTETV
jgi:hypothetical protein